MRDLKIGIIWVLFLGFLAASPAIAETYSCSADLARYGRAGETETKVYTREEDFFWKKDQFGQERSKIIFESQTDVVLAQVSQYRTEAGVFLTIIHKTTNTFLESFLLTRDARDPGDTPLPLWGRCISFD